MAMYMDRRKLLCRGGTKLARKSRAELNIGYFYKAHCWNMKMEVHVCNQIKGTDYCPEGWFGLKNDFFDFLLFSGLNDI